MTIPVRNQKNIKAKIKALSIDPRPVGHIKLRGSSKEALYRIRFGDYRIIYTIKDSILLIIILEIGNRKEIYR